MIKIIPNNNDKKERKYVERERDGKKNGMNELSVQWYSKF